MSSTTLLFDICTGDEGASGGLVTSVLPLDRPTLRGVAVGVHGSVFLRSRSVIRGVEAGGISNFVSDPVTPAFSNPSNKALVRER
jgi:hypothetical protein